MRRSFNVQGTSYETSIGTRSNDDWVFPSNYGVIWKASGNLGFWLTDSRRRGLRESQLFTSTSVLSLDFDGT